MGGVSSCCFYKIEATNWLFYISEANESNCLALYFLFLDFRDAPIDLLISFNPKKKKRWRDCSISEIRRLKQL